jgi:hypothetical protein
MSKATHGVFALVGNFLGKHYMPKHITIDLFEASKTSR